VTLRTLYFDELRGFARSRVMVALWIGLPAISITLKLLQPNTEGIPLFTFVAIMIGSIGGTLSAVLLSTTVTSERARHVYDLFLVRPVRRGVLLISKYLAAITCLFAAAALSLGIAFVVDMLTTTDAASVAGPLGQSILVSAAAMAIASAVGILFGVLINSVAVSAILAVYLGNQLSAAVVLPAVFLERVNVAVFASAIGVGVPVVVLGAAILVFRRRSL
jgi:ABC-2 type transport system permease protein